MRDHGKCACTGDGRAATARRLLPLPRLAHHPSVHPGRELVCAQAQGRRLPTPDRQAHRGAHRSAARRRRQQPRHAAVAPATSDHDAIERRVRRWLLRPSAQRAALPAPRRLRRGTVKAYCSPRQRPRGISPSPMYRRPSLPLPSPPLGGARARLLRLLRARLAALSGSALPEGRETARQASHRPGGSSRLPSKSPMPLATQALTQPNPNPGAGLGVVAIWSRCSTAAWADTSTRVAARAAGHRSAGREVRPFAQGCFLGPRGEPSREESPRERRALVAWMSRRGCGGALLPAQSSKAPAFQPSRRQARGACVARAGGHGDARASRCGQIWQQPRQPDAASAMVMR
jgi:hypothetical protein